jgi:hypothetical protein
MAEKAELLNAELMTIDDQRTTDRKYLIGLTEDKDGSRSLLFDDYATFSKSMTTIEKISALAELMVFIDARIRVLEAKP